MRSWKLLTAIIVTTVFVNGCGSVGGVKTSDFDSIKLYHLKNASGTEVKVTNFGATVTSIKVAGLRHQALRTSSRVGAQLTVDEYLDALVEPDFPSCHQSPPQFDLRFP